MMDESFLAYFEQLEVMAFFAGYSILYALVHVLAGIPYRNLDEKLNGILHLLPLSYALTGLLFLGYLVKNVILVYGQNEAAFQLAIPLIHYAGLLALLFWVPVIRKQAWLSLMHSLFFFAFICIDLIKYLNNQFGVEILDNDMKVLLDSFLMGLFSLTIILLLNYVKTRISRGKNQG